MKNILLISGSRADKGGLDAVKTSLDTLGFETSTVDLEETSVGDTVSYVTDLLDYEVPDLVVVLGDRSEILGATVAAYTYGVPIAHLSGGDVTEGSADDCMRHAITKLSHLHFVTNSDSERRVIQLGEEPWRVHNVGYPGLDNLELTPLEAAKHIANIPSYDDFLLVVWHPDTLVDKEENLRQVHILTRALDKVFMKTLVVGPNTDNGNEVIKGHLKKWCRETKNTYVDELPRKTYLTLLKHCKCLVGNSSSGFYEAPSFLTPVVNAGDRQKGRLAPTHIFFNSPINVKEIAQLVESAVLYGKDPTSPKNPYGDGLAGQRIASIIAKIEDPEKLLRKKWHDVGTTLPNCTEQLGFDTLWGNPYKVQITNEIPCFPKLRPYHFNAVE